MSHAQDHAERHASTGNDPLNLTTLVGYPLDLTAQTGYTSSTYTPALTAVTTNPTLGSGSSVAGDYVQIGKLVIAWVRIQFGTSGTNAGSGTYRVSTPVVMSTAQANRRVGSGVFFDASTFAVANIQVTQDGTNDRVTFVYPTSWPQGLILNVAHNQPWAWAASDEVQFQMIYLAA